MKIQTTKTSDWYRGEARLHLPVSTFRSHAAKPAMSAALRVSTCENREQVQGTSLSAAELSVLRRHDSVLTITDPAVLLPRTGKPAGFAQRNGMGAPRGNPPRSKPKWA